MDLLDPALPVVETAEALPIEELRVALGEASAAISAGQARLAQAMAVYRARQGEAEGSGFTSFGQWASVDLGLSSRAATDLADAGDAVAERPEVRAAWEAGSLSTLKARCVLGVATDESESSWCELAREASATQLSRIARAYRRSQSADADEGREADDREERCGVWWRNRDDGLVDLLATLAPDDAAVVRAALESEMETQWRAEHGEGDDEASVADGAEEPPRPAPRPTARRRLDALIGVAAGRLESGSVPIVRGEHTEVVLHIDEAFLRGRTDAGRCATTHGGELSLLDARRLACDARILGLVEGADGTAVDLGRSQRLVSRKQRRLLAARDHGCRYPGCPNGRYVDAHHVLEWEDGGPTDMANLILLCNRHHRLVHHGAFRIDADGHQGFAFVDRFGRPIRPPGDPAGSRCRGVPDGPRARSGGDPRYSVSDAVTAMASAEHATRHAA